jgi:hypothetical protein
MDHGVVAQQGLELGFGLRKEDSGGVVAHRRRGALARKVGVWWLQKLLQGQRGAP